jgi:hypothetical protein
VFSLIPRIEIRANGFERILVLYEKSGSSC